MKRILILLLFLCSAVAANTQFTSTDTLRKYINRFIRTSPVEAFQNLRLNTALNGMLLFIDSARMGGGGGGGSTNLSFSRTANDVTVLSDAGTDATLPAATTSLAGVMTAANRVKLDSAWTHRIKINDSVTVFYRANGTEVYRDTVTGFAFENGLTGGPSNAVLGGNLNKTTLINGLGTHTFGFDNIPRFYITGKITELSADSVVRIHGADSVELRPSPTTTGGVYVYGKLAIEGSDGRFAPPRLTTTQLGAQTGIPTGSIAYDVTLGSHVQYNGSSWVSFGGGSTYTAGSGLTLTGTTFKGFGTYSENHTSALTTSYYHDFTAGATTVMRINGVNGNVGIRRAPFSTSTAFSIDGTGMAYTLVGTSASGATVNWIVEPTSKFTLQNWTSTTGVGSEYHLTLSSTRAASSGTFGYGSLYITQNLANSGTYSGIDRGIRILAAGTLERYRGIEANGAWEMTSAHPFGLGSATTTQRNAFDAALIRAGSLVYNSTDGDVQYYTGSAWRRFFDDSKTLGLANGGTGQTTANAAFNALAPSQTGNAGEFLTTDGTNTSWAPLAPNPYPWYDAQADSASTSDATATTLRTVTIPNESRGILEVRMDCVNSSTGGSGLTGIKRVRFKKTGGTLTLGTVEDEMAVERDGGLTSANFTITTSSNNIIIQVTGEAATSLKWRATWFQTTNIAPL